MMAPPPDNTPSVINKMRILHKDIYTIGQRLPKKDKLGIHQTIEHEALRVLASLTEAAFTRRDQKLRPLELARIRSSILQHMIRSESELEILDKRTYLRLSEQLVDLSKEISGWISFVSKNINIK
jgi:hypothetical protein